MLGVLGWLLVPLLLTLAIELPVAAALGLRSRHALAVVACVNLLTNPVVNFVGLLLYQVVDWARTPLTTAAFMAPAEVIVVLVEWRLLVWALGGDARRLLWVSIAMNAASALVGLALWWLG